MIASGALQITAVLAQPLPEVPSFFKGGDHAGGLANVHGGEVIQTDKGSFLTNWGKYEGKMIDLPESTIIPNKEVIDNDLTNIVRKGGDLSINGVLTEGMMQGIMAEHAKQLDKSIQNQPVPILTDVRIGIKRQNSYILDRVRRYS